ncbi:SusC/RagA family TonB-linked outer membrane protein [Spirosoma spitsbergense]|uniref:SusC/RagA family TonB-linked outer membrane protein n=1 Tax=Spirosoma spitsbergense TaxID=431554 RepID=UPI00035E1167
MAFLFCLLPGFAALAQTVSGRVTAADDNQPLPGVSILVKGTTTGTTTLADGTYSIRIPANATLTFSFIGYETKEVPVGTRTAIDVSLAVGTSTLNEIVVTALGIKKDIRTIGVSIQSIDGANVTKAREPNPINSLVGKVAGLTIGASAELLRRPNIVLRGNTDVLFVIDGVPINSDTWNISPDDIETYSVLKGASASALYGFRGKNGAILITTKRGSKDKRGFQVDVNTSQMFDNGFLAIPKLQNEYGPGDHGVYAFRDGRGGGYNDGDYDIWGPAFNGQLIPQYDSPVTPGQSYTTTYANPAVKPFISDRQPTPYVARGANNLSRFLQTGILSTNNIAVSSSGEKYDLRFSLSHNYQRGLVPNTKLNSTTFKISTGYTFTDRLRFMADVQVNRQYTPNIPDINYGPNSLIYNVGIWGGADWDVDQLKNYWQPGKEGIQQIYAEYQRYNNPWFVSKEWLRGHYKTDIIGQTSLNYTIAPGLDATLRTQVSTWNLLRTEKMPYSATAYGREEARGDYREDRRNLLDNNTDLLIKYNRKVIPALSINAIAGGNLRVYNYNSNFTSTNYLNVPGVYTFANSANPLVASSYLADMRVLSAYYSADFTLRDFVTLSTTGRVDKLSTLPKGNNTFFYPSVALSTVISDYVQLPAAVSFLKVRGSFANVKDALTQSTIGIPQFPLGYGEQYQSAYDGPTYQNSAVYGTPLTYNNQPSAYYTNTLNNPNIKPNSTSQFETGLDVRFLNNRLTFDAAYYISNDGPRIFNLPISETTGYSSLLVNGIKTQKKGVELSLTGQALRNANGLNWNVLANWSTYTERYKEFYPGVNSLNTFFKVGDRVDSYYTRTYVYSPDGQIINDAGGRPIIGPVSQYVGNINPDWVWGVNNQFRYKALTFSFQFDGRVGGVISDYVQQKAYAGGRIINTVQGVMGEARKQDLLGVKSYVGEGVVVSNGGQINYDADGRVTNYSELQFAPNTTKAFLQDYIARRYGFDGGNIISRSFAKLREVIIGYSLPSALLNRIGVKQASVSLVGRNLLYFAQRKDIDIDQFTGNGRSDLQTPTTRRYGINLNLTF